MGTGEWGLRSSSVTGSVALVPLFFFGEGVNLFGSFSLLGWSLFLIRVSVIIRLVRFFAPPE